jgi:predicted phosphodiesterase
MLTDDERAYLAGLPLQQDLDLDGLHVAMVHAAPGDPLFGYLPASDVEGWRSAVHGLGADLVLVGHTHAPVVLELGGTRVLNPGSVGLPRDGDPRASYALIEDGVPALRRVSYEVGKTVRLLWDWGLPHDVATALESVYVDGELPRRGGAAALR